MDRRGRKGDMWGMSKDKDTAAPDAAEGAPPEGGAASREGVEADAGEAEPRPDPSVEVGGPKGPEPTRYNDWEQKGRCTDF